MRFKIIYLLIIAFFLTSADGCEEVLLIKKTYPNPVATELHVELETEFLEDFFEIDFKVINMNGQVVKTGKFENEVNSINCSELEPGYYVIQLPELGESSKFIKK